MNNNVDNEVFGPLIYKIDQKGFDFYYTRVLE